MSNVLDNWPRDAEGRYLCTPERPMPAERDRDMTGQRWVHADAHEEDSGSDYSAIYKCRSCGHRWSEELPE
jgi:hypothetical protein